MASADVITFNQAGPVALSKAEKKKIEQEERKNIDNGRKQERGGRGKKGNSSSNGKTSAPHEEVNLLHEEASSPVAASDISMADLETSYEDNEAQTYHKEINSSADPQDTDSAEDASDDSPEELAERQRFLEDGRDAALKVWSARQDVPKQVLQAYEAHYPDFQWYWISKMRGKHGARLSTLGDDLGRLEKQHSQKAGTWNRVDDLKASIETLARGWQDFSSNHKSPQDHVALKNELVAFINKVSSLGLNVGLMAQRTRIQEARGILEEDQRISDLLQAAMSLPRSVEMADVLHERNTLECLHSINPSTKSSSEDTHKALEDLRLLNNKIIEKNRSSGYMENDRIIPIDVLKDAMSYGNVEARAAFIRALLIMDTEGYQVSQHFTEYSSDVASQTSNAIVMTQIFHDFLPGISEQVGTKNTPGAGTPAAVWNSDTYVDEHPVANDIETGVTEFGKIVHVRTTGGRNTGYRVIVNIGTEKKPLYDCIPGAELGRGEAERFLNQQHNGVVTKNRQRCHVEHPVGMVQVESRYCRRDGHTSGRNPITYFLIRWSDLGRKGEHSGTHEEQWLTRTELSFCGKRTIEKWCNFFKVKNQHNRQLLQSWKERGLHPDTGAPILPHEADAQPWLVDPSTKTRQDMPKRTESVSSDGEESDTD